MHKIALSDELIAQVQQKRGGRRYLYTNRLEGPKTALLVVDLQNVFMLPGMPVEVPAAREIVPNVNRLAEAMRKAGGKVVWIKMTAEDSTAPWSAFYGRFPEDERKLVKDALTRGSHGHDLHADLDVRPDDLVVEKTRYSVFIQGSSTLHDTLQRLGVDTVVITGTLTNVCCESSARDAMMLNYKTVFVADANAARSDEAHNATLATMLQVFGDVPTTDEVIAHLAPQAAGAAAE
jgi:ureidoacrylate peracid hydrolase